MGRVRIMGRPKECNCNCRTIVPPYPPPVGGYCSLFNQRTLDGGSVYGSHYENGDPIDLMWIMYSILHVKTTNWEGGTDFRCMKYPNTIPIPFLGPVRFGFTTHFIDIDGYLITDPGGYIYSSYYTLWYSHTQIFNFGGISRQDFNNSLNGKIDPKTGNTYPFSHYDNAPDGYPSLSNYILSDGFKVSVYSFFHENYPSNCTSYSSNKLAPPRVQRVYTDLYAVYCPMGESSWRITNDCDESEELIC